MSSKRQENIMVHDIRGQICPSCLLYALREINNQRRALKDDKLKIIIKTDNRHATTTIPDAVATMGYATDITKMPEGYYQIVITARK
jgi:hypothetical protein